MTPRTSVQIELPAALLRRARAPVPELARKLVTFLLESYAQNLERSQRQQAYESCYALRAAEDQDEERVLLADFAFADAEATTEGAANEAAGKHGDTGKAISTMRISAMQFRIEIEQETDGRWIAEVMDIPGVMAYGEDKARAIAKAKALALRVLADWVEEGQSSVKMDSFTFAYA